MVLSQPQYYQDIKITPACPSVEFIQVNLTVNNI